MAVLLIGSTGNGKSTLGNFLINPNDEFSGVFETATDNLPQTQSTKVVSASINGSSGNEIAIIDTPGLNESKTKDLQHMTEVIQTLHNVKKIKACIFVVKFGSKIDQQYKDTVEYYQKLVPTLFSRNVLIAMTHYSSDKRSEAMRKKKKIDVEAIKNNFKKEIVNSARMSYTPILFAIDCLPFDEDEMKVSFEMRKSILSYIFNLEDVNMEGIRVAKTKAIEEDDVRKVKICEGKIDGYRQRMVDVNKDAKSALEEIEMKQRRKAEIERALVSPRQRLKEIDSEDEIVSNSSSIDCGWEWFKYLYTDFDLHSKSDISSVKKWKNGNNKWENFQQERRRVQVRLSGKTFGALCGEVTLYTMKKSVHEDEIATLKSEISQLKVDGRFAEAEIETCKEKHKEHIEKIGELQRFLDDVEKEITALSNGTMSLKEAEERIKNLGK